jgi:hypothetical protein
MQAHGGMQTELHAFLNSVIGECAWSGSRFLLVLQQGKPFFLQPPHPFWYHLERMLPGRCGEKSPASAEYRNPIL